MTIKFLAAAALACSALVSAPVSAHGGGIPKHGGVVQTASDLSFELVASEDTALVYVEDHGQPMVPTGMSGKLTVLKGTEKSEAPLVLNGDKLEAKGIKLTRGAKVVAAISTPDQKVITVRFLVR